MIPGPTQSPTQWVKDAHSPRVKRPGHDADHSPPYGTEVKNECKINFVSIRLRGLYTDEFTLLCLYSLFCVLSLYTV
jgi:hypothetical protein